MKIDKASCYQAVEISVNGKRNNFHTISEEVFPGVRMELIDHVLTVSHKEWDEDVYIFTANIRYFTAKKDLVITFAGMKVVVDPNMPPDGPDFYIDSSFSDSNIANIESSSTLIEKSPKKKVARKK